MDEHSENILDVKTLAGEIDEISWQIGEAFLKGILLEIGCYPKPGLVNPVTSGAHSDMNIITFMVSSAAIAPALYLCAQAGRDHLSDPPELFPKIRRIGIHYEKRLLKATRNVNTQRGALFSAGVLCGAAGIVSQYSKTSSAEEVMEVAAEMTKGLVARDLELIKPINNRTLTAGVQLYLKFGTKGIRGEVESGFPSVGVVGLPAFAYAMRSGLSLNQTLLHTLISLMTCVEDTTILWRRDREWLKAVQHGAGRVIGKGSVFSQEGMEEIRLLDQWLTEQHISPGGSADLLAVTAGIYFLEKGQFEGVLQ